jgi:hypothetical protein
MVTSKKMMLNDLIQKKPITTRNPQANSTTMSSDHPQPRTVQMHKKEFDELDGFDGYLSAVSGHKFYSTLRLTPTTSSAVTCSLPVAEADWNYIADRKQRLIVQNNKRKR